MEAKTKLKPCPFCGADESFLSVVKYANDINAVLCCECGAKSGTGTKKDTIKAWNTRTNKNE